MHNGHTVSAIVNCAGRGTRFGGNKLLVRLGTTTVIEKTVREFFHPSIDQVIVTTSPEARQTYHDILVRDAGLDVKLVDGGEERFISALNGLNQATGEYVIVHDGVRPFVNSDLIERVLDAGLEYRAAMLGMPTVVQLKLVDEDEFIVGSLDRSRSWLGQTPQVFERQLLAKAYAAAVGRDYDRISDDADLVDEFCGVRAKIVRGEDYNLKITTRTDLLIAEQLMVQQDFL